MGKKTKMTGDEISRLSAGRNQAFRALKSPAFRVRVVKSGRGTGSYRRMAAHVVRTLGRQGDGLLAAAA